MKSIVRAALAVALTSGVALGTAGAAGAAEKNWTAPKAKLYAQALSDQTMAQHPELLSVTFHGVPPNMTKVYTMFAGSFPERIGNADDPDDIDVTVKGITIVDPRWHRTNDPQKKFVVLMPLRDQSGENIGLIVYAFKNDTPAAGDERKFYQAAQNLRDDLQKKIPSYAALFEPAK
ncbi:MAG: hypothetical protein JWO66_111 [Candidatus Eremiobacteraeota bacterium]|nr:hypothetical protein [Candidatus Eremiobacteraeota bacterium]